MKSNRLKIFFCLFFFFKLSIQSIRCSCQLDGTGMSMICQNIHSLNEYHQCVHEQLNSQSESKLRRGGIITNLTIQQHQITNLPNNFLQFSFSNILYQFTDLRYLHIVDGTLKQIDKRALSLVERAIEHLDLSNNELEQIPKIFDENEQISSNLEKLTLSNNQITRLTLSDVRSYRRLQQLDLSFNRLQFVDMSIVNELKNLKKLFLNSNQLRTLRNNISFSRNFHFKLSSNPLECDCRLRWLRNALNRLEYPLFHDEPKCETPRALAEKQITSLRDEQFVCDPILTKPDLTILTATFGETTTLRCDVYSDPAPEVWWTFRNKIIGKIITNVNEPEIHTGSYTVQYSCLYPTKEISTNNCLNKTTTLIISNIVEEHNGTYHCVAAIRNQGRSDNEYLSYELRVRRTTSLTENSLLFWTIGLFLGVFILILLFLCICWILRCCRSNQERTNRNKTLLFDEENCHDPMSKRGNILGEKFDEQNSLVTNGTYDPYDMIDSRSQLGPPMYSEVRLADSTPLRSVGGGSISSTLLRRQIPHETIYDSYRSDRQPYEQVYRPSPLAPIIIDEFDEEIIFPTGYEENYDYREDIIKPNQSTDSRRQKKFSSNQSDVNPIVSSLTVRSHFPPQTINNITTNRKLTDQIDCSTSFDSNYKFDRSESQYAGLVESQL